MDNFQHIANFIEEMKATSSTNDKKAILKKYDSQFFRKLLNYTYHPFKKYYVTSDNLKKRSDLCLDNYGNELFQLLDDLNDRNITGHDAIACVNGFIAQNPDHSEIIYDVIDRNLKTRATTTLINSVLPGTIPTFDVALAMPYDEKTKKKVDFNNTWLVSRKLDGIRCISIFDETGKVKFYSRAGNEFLTLSVLATDLEKLNLVNTVIDGEICVFDESGNEDFQGIIKQIGRKDHTISHPMYLAFDMLTISDFLTGESVETFLTRNDRLMTTLANTKLKYAAHLDQIEVNSEDQILELMITVREQGWEGLMLRKDSTYLGKRSNEILKIKEMHDAEYQVIDIETAIQRVIVNGAEIEELMLKNAIVEHRGNRVQVGSGFSLEQRRFFRDNPNLIIGKTITVQYFEETQDQHGDHSLRFPVFTVLHGETRTY